MEIEVQFHLQKEPLGPLSCCWGSLFIHICLSPGTVVLCFKQPVEYFISLPIPSERLSLVTTEIKYWSKAHHLLFEILFLWWCVTWN